MAALAQLGASSRPRPCLVAGSLTLRGLKSGFPASPSNLRRNENLRSRSSTSSTWVYFFPNPLEEPKLRTRILSLITAVAMLALLPQLMGCQMSRASSRSFASMASIWSLSTSFKSSFGGNRASVDQEYARDLAAVSATFVDTPVREAALVRDVTRVAEVHGISDWESVDATWLGIGTGLRQAGMSEPQTIALVARVFGDQGATRTAAALEAQ